MESKIKRQTVLKILFIVMFIYAIRMEATNFIVDQRGIFLKLFEATLELSSILLVWFLIYITLLPYPNDKSV